MGTYSHCRFLIEVNDPCVLGTGYLRSIACDASDTAYNKMITKTMRISDTNQIELDSERESE